MPALHSVHRSGSPTAECFRVFSSSSPFPWMLCYRAPQPRFSSRNHTERLTVKPRAPPLHDVPSAKMFIRNGTHPCTFTITTGVVGLPQLGASGTVTPGGHVSLPVFPWHTLTLNEATSA